MIVYENYLSTLTKTILMIAVLVVSCTFMAGRVEAQTTNVAAEYTINIDTASNPSKIDFQINLKNSTSNLIDNYTFKFPDKSLTGLQVLIDNQYLTPQIIIGDKDTTISVNLGPMAIRPGTSKTLHFKFNSSNVFSNTNGLYQVYLPGFSSTYSLNSVLVNLTYKQDLGDPLFLSVKDYTNSNGTIHFSGINGFLIVWGKSAKFRIKDKFDVIPNSKDSAVAPVSLPPSLQSQRIYFDTLIGINSSVKDRLDNVLGTISTGNAEEYSVAYTAIIEKTLAADSSNIVTPQWNFDLELPDELLDIDTKDSSQINTTVYNYMINNYSPDRNPATTIESLEKLPERLAEEDRTLKSFEYVSLQSFFLSKLGVQNRVLYGYILTPQINGIDANLPIVWLEINTQDGRVQSSAYLGAVTGQDFSEFSPLMTLTMGVWDPSVNRDNVLGILGGSLRLRPEIAGTDEDMTEDIDWTMNVTMPGTGTSGIPYNAEILLKNNSRYFLEVGSVQVDDVAYSKELLSLNNGEFRKLILPGGEAQFSINNLGEPYFMFKGEKTNVFTVTLANEIDNRREVRKSILLTENFEFMYLLAIVLVVIAGVLVIVTIYLVFSKRIKSFTRKRSSVAKPVVVSHVVPE